MQKETLEYTKKYDQCQRFTPNTHQPGGFLNPLSSPWPFAQWGLDIVGPLEIFLEEHCHPLRNTSFPHLRQWTSVRQQIL